MKRSIIAVIAALGIMIACAGCTGNPESVEDEVTQALSDAKLDEIVESLNQVAGQLALVDWESLGSNMNSMAVQAQESLVTAQEALAKAGKTIDDMDIKALNQAIKDLQAVIEPLAKLVGKFK